MKTKKKSSPFKKLVLNLYQARIQRERAYQAVVTAQKRFQYQAQEFKKAEEKLTQAVLESEGMVQ